MPGSLHIVSPTVGAPAVRPRGAPIITSVVRSCRIGDAMQEVTLRGPAFAFDDVSPDQYFLVVVAGENTWPGLITAALRESDLRQVPFGERPASAHYTVRRHRPELGEIDLWVAVHGASGSVSQWATEAVPGTPVALFGPHRHFRLPAGIESAVLMGDETAYAAVACIAETLPPSVQVQVCLEAAAYPNPVDLELPSAVDLQWVCRGSVPAGVESRLIKRLKEFPVDSATVVFAGCEASQAAQIRRFLRERTELPVRHRTVVSYWRRDVSRNPGR